MSYNKKALRVDLGKYYKPNPYKKDMNTDPAGLWKFDGPVKVPNYGSEDMEITMDNVNVPVMGIASTGQQQMMMPWQQYTFPGADYVNEYPIMKVGGIPELPLNAGRRAYHAWGYTNNDFIVNRQEGGPYNTQLTPEEWEKQIRNVEGQIGDPSGWSLDDYNSLQNTLDQYRSWRENTPEGQAVIDSHNQEGEYDIPVPEHLQDYTNAVMKSRLAYANEFGNPAAKRMVNIPDNPYQFEDGNTGTHFMTSMDNYAVPQIQEENNELVYGNYDPDSNEAIRFDNEADAQYFARNYKDVSPGFIEAKLTPEEIEQYRQGGYIVEELPKAQTGKATYADSLSLYNNALQQKAYYNKLRPYYKSIKVDPYFYETFSDIKRLEKEHLTYNNLAEALGESNLLDKVKSKIKSNKDPNKAYLLDMITGALDLNAPMLEYNANIKPQGKIEYEPKQAFTNLPKKLSNIVFNIDPTNMLGFYLVKHRGDVSYLKDIKELKDKITKRATAAGFSKKDIDKAFYAARLDQEVTKKLPGYITTLPYYDPIAVKPASLLTDEELKKRVSKYGPSGIPQSRLQKLNLSSTTQAKPVVKKKTNVIPKTTKLPAKVAEDKVKPLDAKTSVTPTTIKKEVKKTLPNKPAEKVDQSRIKPAAYKAVWKQNPVTGTWYQDEVLDLKGDSTVYNPATGGSSKPKKEWTYGYEIDKLKLAEGGYIETKLSPEEIQQYRDGGYIVEDISVPQLTKAQIGLIKNPYHMPAGVQHPMQVTPKSKKAPVTYKPKYDPLLDSKVAVSESTKPTQTFNPNINIKDAVKEKKDEREVAAYLVSVDPLLSEKDKVKILSDPKKIDENIYRVYQENDNEIKQVAPQSKKSRAWEYVTNPLTALKYSITTGDMSNMPHNINEMRRAGVEVDPNNLVGNILNDFYNPASVADNMTRSFNEGDYLSAGLDALTFVPGVGLVKKIGKGADKLALSATKKLKAIPGQQSLDNFVRAGVGSMDMSQHTIKNPDYYTQLLDTYTSNQLSPSNKKFYKDLIETIKKQEGVVTQRQYNELQRLNTGNFDFGKKAYDEGGSIDLELSPDEIKAYQDQGYTIEYLD